MSILNKVYERIGYLFIGSNIPIFIMIGIDIVEKTHNYIEKSFINHGNIIKLLDDFERVTLTGTGVLLIFYKEKVLKYPLGKRSVESLNLEYKNYLLLKQTIHSNLVDYRLEVKEEYYLMDKLLMVEHPVKSHKKIYNQLSQTKSNNNGNILSIIKPQNIENVLKRSEVNKDEIKYVLNYLKNINCQSIVMHGDLTQFNIMVNKKNKIVLIDLDWFNFNGIENIDRMHFIIEFYAKRKKTNYLKVIIDILNTKHISPNLLKKLFLYFFYRISIEYNKDIILRSTYYNDIFTIIYNINIKDLK